MARFVALVNADPEAGTAGEGWIGSLGVVVERDPPGLEQDFVVVLHPDKGRLSRVERVAHVAAMEALGPAYEARATLSTWQGLMTGELEPFSVLLLQTLRVRGDLQPLVERLQYKGFAERVLRQLSVGFKEG